VKNFTNRQVAKALRAKGDTVVIGAPSWKDNSNFWIIGDDGETHVLNVQVHSVLGKGCYGHPDYESTRQSMVERAKSLLDAAGIPYTLSLTPDQLFLNGWEPKFYDANEEARYRAKNA
jgi:hypothetical protein